MGTTEAAIVLRTKVAGQDLDLTTKYSTTREDITKQSWEFAGDFKMESRLELLDFLNNLLRDLGIDSVSISNDTIPSVGIDELFFKYSTRNQSFQLKGKASCNDYSLNVKALTTSEKIFALGLNLDTPIGLSSLPPAISSILPDLADISISQFGVFYASQDIKDSENFFELNKEAIGKGISFGVVIKYRDKVVLQIPEEESGQTGPIEPAAKKPPAVKPTEKKAAPDDGSDGFRKWFSVNKTVGPLNIQRIGGEYREGKVGFLFDAGIDLLGLKVGLAGLRFGMPIADLRPQNLEFGLDGLDISFKNGPVEISGGFLERNNMYSGEVMIKAENFGISALGSYGEVDGKPSLFIFAVLDAPLGGPSFFFVTGLAAGFGLNRGLRIPSIDDVFEFSLVKYATGDQAPPPKGADQSLILRSMGDDIYPAPGVNWIAAGVKFTSFEMIRSFALLSVTFGTSFEIALLGRATLTVPRGAQEPVAIVQLALAATFSLDSGLLAVSAKLMPGSYVFSSDCHLTGGFAFYVWFAGSEHEGDFVVTLGGYHPLFPKPAHYPDVPRLGIDWKVSDNASIKGGVYFALTPSCVMVGGGLEATWQSGDLKAWFLANADFLVSWEPFYYDIQLSVSMGASYALFGNTSLMITVHIGASLHLWGPPFAGTAYVDLTVISFTVSLGDSQPSRKPIPWSKFKSSFLPEPWIGTDALLERKEPLRKEIQSEGAIATNTICGARVSRGLVRDLSQAKDYKGPLDWIVNPDQFTIATHSAIPAKTAVFNGAPVIVQDEEISWSQSFGIGPVGVASADFNSQHGITITRNGTPLPQSGFVIKPIIKDSPKALWYYSDKLIMDPDALIKQTLVGFAITPRVTPPNELPPIQLETLQLDTIEGNTNLGWETPPTVKDADSGKTVAQTINAPSVAVRRAKILDALVNCGVVLDTNVDLSRLADPDGPALLQPPVLGALGS